MTFSIVRPWLISFHCHGLGNRYFITIKSSCILPSECSTLWSLLGTKMWRVTISRSRSQMFYSLFCLRKFPDNFQPRLIQINCYLLNDNNPIAKWNNSSSRNSSLNILVYHSMLVFPYIPSSNIEILSFAFMMGKFKFKIWTLNFLGTSRALLNIDFTTVRIKKIGNFFLWALRIGNVEAW